VSETSATAYISSLTGICGRFLSSYLLPTAVVLCSLSPDDVKVRNFNILSPSITSSLYFDQRKVNTVKVVYDG
jgi:hypothetical protein